MKSIRPFRVTCPTTSRSAVSRTASLLLLNTSIRASNHDRQRRPFLTTNPFASRPFSPNQTITATRTLPYPRSAVFRIIADVGAYSEFLPYCHGSVVTRTSARARDGRRYPEEATLTIGFSAGIAEAFTSRVYCVPERVVEAVSGRTATSLRGDEIAHHSPRAAADSGSGGGGDDAAGRDATMAHLLTRWTLRPLQGGAGERDGEAEQRTEVSLAIEFAFANPLYAAISSTAAPKVADRMIEAFEDRVRTLCAKPSGT